VWLHGTVNAEAEKIIAQLGLAPLPQEGGFFRRTWVSSTRLANGRAAASAIWFLLTDDGFSALHRLPAEELWQFYAGDAVEHVQLDPATGAARVNVLGPDLAAKQRPQLVVPGGVWQGARLLDEARPRGWALLGCTVTPAWDDGEFELGSRETLLREFPGETGWIGALTR
jgi:predicted cupin superfamily sugar epimerase